MRHPTAPAVPPGYRAFYDAVARAQLVAWLPRKPAAVVDLSGDRYTAGCIAAAGHGVIQVIDGSADGARGTGQRDGHGPGTGRIFSVIADCSWPTFLADTSVDAVVANRLGRCLVIEAAMDEIARALRPGGRLLLCVDSLVRGMSRLAEQSRWAQLSDVPSAEVVLVPAPDGSITRCFSPEQLEDVLAGAGLDVEWIRPRTVLSPSLVEHALRADPGSLRHLVDAELSLDPRRAGETAGIHLVAAARRP